MRSFSAVERRARLARRQHLAPDARADGVEQAARGVVALHATTPSSVYLSAWARTDGFRLATMDAALYEERTLVKHLAMRRTLFVFPVDDLPTAQAGASARVARAEAGRLVREVEKGGLHLDGAAWLAKAKHAVLEALEGGRELTSTQLREELPLLEGAVVYGVGKKWGGEVPVGPRVLTVLSAEGRIVRATNDGAWTVSRPRWASMAAWTGATLPEVSEREGVAGLVRRWLAAFGPGTVRDVTWWLGGTLTATRQALADVGAVEVDLEGTTGFVLPDDLEPTEAVEPWAALLPELDPTTMGWAEREWYLGEHRAEVFDSNGNGGNTAWWEGRIVGGWAQSPAGEVVLHLLEDVGSDGRQALEAEASRLGDWLAGARVTGRYPSPLVTRAARGTSPDAT